MAGSEVPQHGALNIGYNYQPVETKLNPPIQLPGTGELWANVGRTAMDAVSKAGQMLQNSPLNPDVRETMNYSIAQHKAGEDQINYLKSLGPLGHVMGSTSPQGYSTAPISSVADPTLAARMTANMGVTPQPGGGGSGPPPAVNNPSQQQSPQDQGQSDLKQHPENYFLNPATGSYERRSDAPPPAAPAAPSQPQQKGPPSAGDMGKTASAGPSQSATDAAIREGLSRNQFASSEPGIPADYQPPQQQSGSIWSPMRPSPAAPPAPGAPPAQPEAQGQAPAPQSDPTALAQWQAQNAHPVMSSQDALSWMKSQTTLAQDATYLPHGGPGGEPAYAFHIKGGGINTVPISQMVKSGAGPLVAAQNTSAVLSASDKLTNPPGAQGQPPAPQAPPDQPQVAQGPPAAPTGPLPGAQGQPPAAQGPPAAPGMTDIYGNPLSAYTNVASKGGQTPDTLGAQTAPAGVPAPVPAPNVPQPDQAAVQAQADKMGDPPKDYKGDSVVPGTTGPYTYYRDDNPDSPSRGRVYSVLPGQAGGYYNQQRWYLGTPSYQNYELPDSVMRQHMVDSWVPTGQLTRGEIDKMSPQEMEPWLKQAWYNDHMAKSDAATGLNQTLDASEELHNTYKQIGDIVQTLGQHGITNLNSIDKFRAAGENAAVSLETKGHPWMQQGQIERTGNVLGAGLGFLSGMDENTASAIRTLDQKIDHAHSLMAQHPELLINPGKGGGVETPNVNIPNIVHVGLPNMPDSDVISDVFSGQDMGTKLKNLSALQKASDDRYRSLIGTAQTQWQRIDPKHGANMARLDQGQDFPDQSNLYQNHTFPNSGQASTATATPTPTPEVKGSLDDAAQYAKTHKSGEYFMYNGHKYQVQ